jgi:uncharacterized protein
MPKKKTVKKTVPAKASGKRLLYTLIAVVIVIGLLLIIILPNFTEEESTGENYMFKKEGELTFTDSLGTTKVKIDIEIADTEYERQLGLMNRKEMDELQGMLFIFPKQTYQSFWMRNTLISLDILFVNENFKVVTIHKNTQTLSDKSYPSDQPAKYVVEVIAGFTDKYNIVEGDKINWMGIKL